ncbi:MAG: T9SS type A sorting domain-containing protein [Chitinivibrionia bacterium]|nr:T9SS type A sorting domain-containing protein [Chitinivibrionia bacterium]
MKRKISLLSVFLLSSIAYSWQIQVPIHSVNSSTTIELYNVKGQKIFSKEFSRYDDIPFSLSNNLSNQIYIMRVKNGNGDFTRKFMPNYKIKFTGTFANTDVRQLRSLESVEDSVLLQNLYPPYEKQNQNALRSSQAESSARDSVTNIIFINGIWNKREKAETNYKRIRDAYEKELSDRNFPGKYKFTLGYNKKHGKVGDLAEVIFQLLRNAGASDEFITENSQEWLPLIVSADDYVEALRLADSLFIDGNVAEKIRIKVSEIILNLRAETVVDFHNETATELKKIIDNSFNKKERVIIISHSQGNIYANALVQELSTEKLLHTAVLNVAPPTTRASTGWWWTNNNDAIINLARSTFNGGILLGHDNPIAFGKKPRDKDNHQFWESYFYQGLASRAAIDARFFTQCDKLPFWANEEDKNEYYFIVKYYDGAATTKIELSLNNGDYVTVGTYVGYNLTPNDTVKVSNVEFRYENPVVKITTFHHNAVWGPIYSTDSKTAQLISISEQGERLYKFSDAWSPGSLDDGRYSIVPVKK